MLEYRTLSNNISKTKDSDTYNQYLCIVRLSTFITIKPDNKEDTKHRSVVASWNLGQDIGYSDIFHGYHQSLHADVETEP
jgi:hypothetical protein